MNHQIKDDFLNSATLAYIKEAIFFRSFPWYIAQSITGLTGDDSFYLSHLVTEDCQVCSPEIFFKLDPILKKLDIFTLKRIKINFYPVTSEIVEHEYHIDYPTPHTAAIFYLNSNDGSTILDDGTRIESIENRLLLFEGHVKHKSTSCTDDRIGRFNINFNFINT